MTTWDTRRREVRMSMSKLETFDQYRPLLFSIAYRMLGTASDAEDVLQETFLRWHEADESEVRGPRAFLSTVVTRLCIDQLRSARARRELYVGPWLPEPILTQESPDMVSTVELAESLSFAFLRLLESLTPTERAVFLLREVFGYSYEEVAAIVGKSEANCRQMVHRAQQHLREGRPRFEIAPEQQEKVTERFLEVCAGGDMQGLLDMLAQEVTLVSDGGGKAQAALNVLQGPSVVARFMFGVTNKIARGATVSSEIMEINGQPGAVIYVDDKVDTVMLLEMSGGQVRTVNIVRNPDKLEAFTRQGGPAPERVRSWTVNR